MVISPTLKYTSFGMPTAVTASTEPSAPTGTISMTTSGIAQLSYSATSSRKTTSKARANSPVAWPLATFSW
ncbi:hypothetical protein ALP64_200511 [Pseudomonas syringae pv. actinidiae]|nr:hypothetical protein ALP64_200511 [Pseudomonas syringae pv. actinidiae]